MRNIHADTLAALGTNNRIEADLLTINFTDEVVYITNHSHDITYNGQNYTASGHILSLSPVNESSEIKVGACVLTLSGVDQFYIAKLLSQNVHGRQVLIDRVLLDSAGAVIGNAINVHDGRIDQFAINEQTNTCTIALNLTSHWADFGKMNGRSCNNASQQAAFPGDLFFDQVGGITQDLEWGIP